MSQTVPDFTTAIVTILFLSILAIVAYVIKIKSGSLKKIIKKQNQQDLEMKSRDELLSAPMHSRQDIMMHIILKLKK